MLFHYGAPLFLRIDAFTIDVYLMNRLSSFALNFETPYFSIHGTHLNYSSLRAFGSKCFLYTWDIQKQKFDPKILSCIFVGYSEKHRLISVIIQQAKRFLSLLMLSLMR